MLSLISSCTTTSDIRNASNPITNAKAACPVPFYPTDEAWHYRDSLPADTPAQREFRDWTQKVLVQQTLLNP